MLANAETMFYIGKALWHGVRTQIETALSSEEALKQSKLELPQKAVALIEQYKLASKEIERQTQKKLEAEKLLQQMLGKHEVGTVGDTIISWKTITQERLDSKTLKAEHPVLFQKYVNKTSYRRFSGK